MLSDSNPPELKFDSAVLSIDFHPTNKIIATSLSANQFHVYEFSKEGNNLLINLPTHISYRDLTFSSDGNYVFAGCADGALVAIDINKQQHCYTHNQAHPYAIYSILVHDNLLASGDEEGQIKLWDLRTQKIAFEFHENTDYISDMDISTTKNRLFYSSADGSLNVINLRAGKLEETCEPKEDEFLSVAVIKDSSLVLCGTQSGVVHIFNWGEWSEPCDKMLGHPLSVDTMVKVDEDTICTGSSDGFLRLAQIQPNKFISVIGEHEDQGISFPVEKVIINEPNEIMASSSHDCCVKLWDIRYLFENDEEGEGMAVDAPQKPVQSLRPPPVPKGPRNKQKSGTKRKKSSSFYRGL